jgi:foldase protein PrsA
VPVRNLRSLALIAALPLALGSLTACGTAAHAGAAATVGDARVSLDDLRSAVEKGYVGAVTGQTTKLAFQRAVLERLLTRQLDETLAKDLQLSIGADEVSQRLAGAERQAGGRKALQAQAANAGVSPEELPAVARDAVVRERLAAALLKSSTPSEADLQGYYQQNLGTFQTSHAAHILVADEGLALQIKGDLVAHPDKFAELAKRYSMDTSNKDTGGDLGAQPRGTFVKEFDDAIFAAQAGQLIGPVKTQFGYHVIKVLELTNESFEQARSQILTMLSDPTGAYASRLLARRLAAVSKRLHVHVSSRFGRWDPATIAILPPDSDPRTATSVTGGTGAAAPSGVPGLTQP